MLKDELKVDEKDCLKMLNIALRRYFSDVARTLSFLLNVSSHAMNTIGDKEVLIQLNVDLPQNLHEQQIYENMNVTSDILTRYFRFYECNKYVKGINSSVCYHCKIADLFDKDYDREPFPDEEKLKNKYAKCCSKFAYNTNNTPDTVFKLNSEFYKNYSRIKYFTLRDAQLEEKENKFEKFDKLIDIQLDNNRLAQMPESLLKLKTLLSLSLKNNPITTIETSTFGALTSLITLEIENVRLVIKPNELLDLPPTLENLIVRQFSAHLMPFNFLTKNSTITQTLKSLTFSGVEWIDTTPYAPFKSWLISKENFFTRFERLFSNEQLTSLFHYFDVSKDDALDPDEVTFYVLI
jgi:hypothetical protein